jgi:hypothetical protein
MIMGAYKNIAIEYQQMFNQVAENFKMAGEIPDTELWEAVLVNTIAMLPSWLERLQELTWHENAESL